MNQTNNVHIFTKISLGIDIAAIAVLFYYFTAVAPFPPITGLYGLLIMTPPVFGVFGIITALMGRKRSKTGLSLILIIVNIVFLCWWPIIMYSGTLMFGV